MIQDILLDSDFDLLIVNGDFAIGDGIDQEIALLINTWVGHWKQNPLLGVGITQHLNSSGQGPTIIRNIGVALDTDKIIIDALIVDDTNLEAPGAIFVEGHRNE